MKLSVFVAKCLAQSPDLENDFGIGRAVLTPEDALKQYTEMNKGQINRLLRGDFDIMDFKLSESNSGFFLTQTKSKHMDLFFNYDKSDLESADAYAYGIVEYHGCITDVVLIPTVKGSTSPMVTSRQMATGNFTSDMLVMGHINGLMHGDILVI
jgi:hypothetical protein